MDLEADDDLVRVREPGFHIWADPSQNKLSPLLRAGRWQNLRSTKKVRESFLSSLKMI